MFTESVRKVATRSNIEDEALQIACGLGHSSNIPKVTLYVYGITI